MTFSDQRLVGEPSPEEFGPGAALQFLIDQPGRILAPDECKEFVAGIAAAASSFGVKFAPRFVQACVETNNARYGGQVGVEQKNIGGIGATDDGAPGVSNPTWARAGLVFVAHSLAWAGDVRGDASPRYALVVQKARITGYATTFRDLGNGRWATDPIYGQAIDSRYAAIAKVRNVTKLARVPKPPITNHLYVSQNKFRGHPDQGVEGRAIQRKPLGTCLHSMVGTLAGTDGWFPNAAALGLTDFGIGAKEQALGFAEIIQWTDPFGTIVGWASGPTDNPEGDGPAFIAAHGRAAVNVNLASIEHDDGGDPASAMTGPEWASSCWLQAYIHDNWLDQTADTYGENYHHYEFCGKAYKKCPFPRIEAHTDNYQQTIRAIMRHFNEGRAYAPEDKVVAGLTIAVPLNTGKPASNPPPVYPESFDAVTGFWVGEPLLAFFRLMGGYAVCGHPLGGMVAYSDGVLRQPFEYVCLGYNPETGLTKLESIGAALANQTSSPYPVWHDAIPLL